MAREIEIKLDLGSFANYLKLLGSLGEMGEEEQQKNVFFDTKDRLLGKQGWALRVRTSNDKAYLTLKGISAKQGSATIREEIETEIPKALAERLIAQEADLLTGSGELLERVRSVVADRDVTPFLAFDNLRRARKYRLGDREFVLEVDRTEYADGYVDYELEVELDRPERAEMAEQGLRKLFGSLEIPFVQQLESKFGRALIHRHAS